MFLKLAKIATICLLIISPTALIADEKPQTKKLKIINLDFPEFQSKIKKGPIDFTISIVCTRATNCKHGIAALEDSIKYIESKVPVKFTIVNEFYSNEDVQGTILERWEAWAKIAVKLGSAKSDLAVILLEASPENVDEFDFKEEGVLGLASGIGVLGIQPSAVFIKVMGGKKFMTRLITHEIGHVLGGRHTKEGIMQPSASSIQYSDAYSLFTISQIKTHLENVRFIRALMEVIKGEAKNSKIKGKSPSKKEEEATIDVSNPVV